MIFHIQKYSDNITAHRSRRRRLSCPCQTALSTPCPAFGTWRWPPPSPRPPRDRGEPAATSCGTPASLKGQECVVLVMETRNLGFLTDL